jgi:hypothetical protein
MKLNIIKVDVDVVVYDDVVVLFKSNSIIINNNIFNVVNSVDVVVVKINRRE